MRTRKEVVGIGKRIKTKREEKGLSLEKLADKANVAFTTMFKLERGEIKNPSVATIMDVAKALCVERDILIGDDVKKLKTITSPKRKLKK
ncbi:MAG: helix-turn-helix transcriptional regulator [Candidatus Campbellbacteria bacterium]|nr:helix-turn-helix transcriptional regulator [Candidatus Campbellbacteria bacterium]